jgi:hypothetical protein
MIAILVILSGNIQAQAGGPRGKVISAYSRTDQGPGKMHLLPGYVAGLPEGSLCMDTECGYIWNPRGLTISYDIGGLAGPGLAPESSDEHAWYGEADINGQTVRYAVSGERKPDFIMVSFPASYANFHAELRNDAEIRPVLQMILTYQGKGYDPDPKGHVRFLNVLPGHYELRVASQGDCKFAPRRWKMTMEPAEVLLRSFSVPCG